MGDQEGGRDLKDIGLDGNRKDSATGGLAGVQTKGFCRSAAMALKTSRGRNP
jgi:hypothetical protein